MNTHTFPSKNSGISSLTQFISLIKKDNEYIGLNEFDFNTYSNNTKIEKEVSTEKAFSKDLLTIIKEYKNNTKNTKKRKRRRRKKRQKHRF